jgi:hypothetical protein
MRRLIGAALIIIGAGAFTACLRSAFTGMRNVMVNDGGFCASGGPYVIAQHCSSGDMRLLMVGIFGGLVATAVYAGGTSALRVAASSAGLICWVALFGAFGWNFIDQYLHPAAGHSGSVGFLTSGIVFWAMALGGLFWLVASMRSDLRPARPSSRVVAATSVPLVQAVIPPGFGTAPDPSDIWSTGGQVRGGTTALGVTGLGAAVDAVPPPRRASAFLSTGIWFVLSALGAAVGLGLSSSLVSALS